MRTPTLSALVLSSLLAAPAGAQILTETFSGNTLPANWQVRSGTWSIKNGRAVQSAFGHRYMTLKGIKLLNCVVEADVYWTTNMTQFGGVTARHAGTSADDCVMVKVQQNGANKNGFDTLWNYERPGAAIAKTGITPLMKKTRIRLVVLGDRGWLYHDSTQDGIYDTIVGPRIYSAHKTAGEIGIGCSGSEIDNFALYNAVLIPDGTSTPKLGTKFKMAFHTSLLNTVFPWVCALSLTNGGTQNGKLGGIPLGSVRVPLGVDPLLNVSVALGRVLGITGVVTDGKGVGYPTLTIPNQAALVGVGMHIAGVTADLKNVSNNHYFKIIR